jgi:glutaredoxin
MQDRKPIFRKIINLAPGALDLSASIQIPGAAWSRGNTTSLEAKVISGNQRILWLPLIVCIVLAASPNAQSEIYRWTDENGKVHFSDKPSVEHSSKTVEVRINTYQSVAIETSTFDVGKKVVMYSASWCGVCEKAKSYFKRKGIQFTEYDVEKSAKGRSEYKKLKAKGVPVILVGKERMNGFSIERFERLYR